MRKTKKKQNQFWKNVLLLIISLLLMLIIVEVFLRATHIVNPPNIKYNSDYIYTFNPSSHFVYYDAELKKRVDFYTSERGFSKGIDTYQNNSNTKMLFVGDSFLDPTTLGGESEKLFSSRFIKDNFNVMTIGVDSYAFDNEYKIVEDQIKQNNEQNKPKIVVVAVFMNDLLDSYRDTLFKVEDGKLIRQKYVVSKSKKIMFLCTNSLRACNLVMEATRNALGSNSNNIAKFFGVNDVDRSSNLHYLMYALPYELFTNKTNDPTVKMSITKTDLIFQEYNKLEKDNNVTIVFFLVPIKEQVSQRKLAEFLSQNNITNNTFDINTPYDIIKSLMIKNNLPYIDALPAYVGTDSNNSLYHEIDGHWNEYGHELAYNITKQYLETKKII